MTPAQRRRCMQAIKGRDTLPEVIVRKWLYANGWRFRCQYKKVPGHPDVAIPKIKTLIEIRGCFWHRHGWEMKNEELRMKNGGGRLFQKEFCPIATTPKSNKAFWTKKFRANSKIIRSPFRLRSIPSTRPLT